MHDDASRGDVGSPNDSSHRSPDLAPTGPLDVSSGRVPDGKRHVFDNPRNVRFVIWALVASCVFLFVLDFTFAKHGTHYWVEHGIPNFYGLYGFVGCVVLVLVAKAMRLVVMREEDYYDR